MAYNKLSTYKTSVFSARGRTYVQYHATNIVEFDGDTVTLNSGGWQSVTTKRKMNQASHQFGLGYGVYQRNHVWYVDLPNGQTVEFEDGMTFTREAVEA